VKKKSQQDPEMLPEYNFSGGVRGKHVDSESKHRTLLNFLGDEHVADIELELPKFERSQGGTRTNECGEEVAGPQALKSDCSTSSIP
jgi:hypothetical protein